MAKAFARCPYLGPVDVVHRFQFREEFRRCSAPSLDIPSASSGELARHVRGARDLFLTSRAPAEEVDHVLEDGKASIRRPDRAIGDARDAAAVQTDQMMVVSGSTEDVPYHPVRLRERSAEPCRQQSGEEAIHGRSAGTQPRPFRGGAEFLGSVPAPRGREQPDEPPPERGDAQSGAPQICPDRIGNVCRHSVRASNPLRSRTGAVLLLTTRPFCL
jgi:hypothetical protein